MLFGCAFSISPLKTSEDRDYSKHIFTPEKIEQPKYSFIIQEIKTYDLLSMYLTTGFILAWTSPLHSVNMHLQPLFSTDPENIIIKEQETRKQSLPEDLQYVDFHATGPVQLITVNYHHILFQIPYIPSITKPTRCRSESLMFQITTQQKGKQSCGAYKA